MSEGLSIQAVSERCGVNPVTLRAWERRYGLIRPARTERGHRRYSAEDVARIRRIVAWLDRGLPIGQVRAVLDGRAPPALAGDPWRQAGDEALAALEELNTRRLEQWFQRLTGDYPWRR
ncbi:MerR family transcriptional regulator [Alcanivorax sp. IO_7]|nr:MerR family transcriptional regulator [Alcanivorax sp. IO_7]